MLPDGCIADILMAVRDCFDIEDDAEITMECNPGTVNESRLSEYRAAGVNRLSFGLQSADNNELKCLGEYTHLNSSWKASGWQEKQDLIILMLTLCLQFRVRLKQRLKIHLTR